MKTYLAVVTDVRPYDLSSVTVAVDAEERPQPATPVLGLIVQAHDVVVVMEFGDTRLILSIVERPEAPDPQHLIDQARLRSAFRTLGTMIERNSRTVRRTIVDGQVTGIEVL